MAVYVTDIDRDRRDIDVSEKIWLLEPDATPLAVILGRARKRPVNSAEWVWFEDELGARWDRINNGAGYLSTDTALVVDNGSYFRAKDVVKVPRTAEVLFVSSVSTNTLTVVRGYGSTAAAALVDNDYVVIIGNALEENSSAPGERIGQPTKKNNYAQIFRTTWSVSGTTEAEKQRTSEQERARLSKKKGIEHRVDLERAFLFGEAKEDTTNKRRMSRGVLATITTNSYDAGGTLTESEFETSVCETAFRYGSSKKLLVGSPRVISVLNQLAAARLETVPKQEVYGLQVKRYLSAHGELLLVKSNVLENYYANHAFILDIDNVAYRPLRDTKLKRNIQANDLDGFQDEYFTEAGFEVKQESTHMILSNVTG